MSEGPEHGRDSGSYVEDGNGHVPFYTIHSNQSGSSIFEDVEMAQNEVCKIITLLHHGGRASDLCNLPRSFPVL